MLGNLPEGPEVINISNLHHRDVCSDPFVHNHSDSVLEREPGRRWNWPCCFHFGVPRGLGSISGFQLRFSYSRGEPVTGSVS